MKKFSKSTGVKVNEDPILKSSEVSPEDKFRFEVKSIMDSHLKVQFLGSIDAVMGGSMKVSGQDEFVEALLELIQSKTSKDKVKLLESLKYDIGDWVIIDSKIDEIELNEKLSILNRHKERLKEIFKRYKNDTDLFLNKLDRAISKMQNGKTAFYRSLAAEEMSKPGSGFPNNIFKQVSNKYLLRSQQLGYHRHLS